MLENLPSICKNYKNGCREIKTDAVELKHHQEQCVFREVFCLDWDCRSKNKVIFNDFFQHLVKVHKFNYEVGMSEEEENKWFYHQNFFNFLPLVSGSRKRKISKCLLLLHP